MNSLRTVLTEQAGVATGISCSDHVHIALVMTGASQPNGPFHDEKSGKGCFVASFTLCGADFRHSDSPADFLQASSHVNANPVGWAIRPGIDHTIQDFMTSAVSHINSEIRERQVSLTGLTKNWHEKQRAQELLRSISRSFVIDNDISVAGWK